MSALAKILLGMNYHVTGSDLNESNITRKLNEMGAVIFYNHSAGHTEGADLVVFSTAIPPTNPEIQAAREKGITLWHRSELLACLLNSRFGIAVAGTHGKTTTTAMVSLVLEKAGLDPTAVIGGELSDFDGNARLGESRFLVAEACESDHSFLRYKPVIAVITNVEADHLEHYGGSFKKIIETYENFLGNLKEGGTAVISGDDVYLEEMSRKFPHNFITYGIHKPADYTAKNIRYLNRGSVFEVYFRGGKLGTLKLAVTGEYNIYNTLATVAVGRMLGVEFSTIKKIMGNFKGAKRRFQIIGETRDIIVVDDYAHHPTELKATLGAAKSYGKKRVIAVFQPHRYSRTYYLFDDFVESFTDADVIIITPIFSAGEEPIKGVSSEVLAQKVGEKEKRETVLLDFDQVEDYLFDMVKPGDLVITMGAGDIWKAAHGLVEKLEKAGCNIE